MFNHKKKPGVLNPIITDEETPKLKGKLSITNSKYILKNAYSGDHITADICDDLGYFYLVPIKPKFVQQGKIFIKIKDEVYLFAVDESKIKTSKSLGSKGIRKLYYSTKNVQPIDFSDLADIEQFKKNNPGLKKVESMHAVLIMVCNEFNINNESESNEVQSVSMNDAITSYIKNYTNNNEEDPKTVKLHRDLKLASKDFGSNNMVLPLNPVSSFLSATVQTSPINIMALISSLEKKYFEWKKIANPQKKPFQHWLLIFGILGFVSIIGIAGYFLSGAADQNSLIEQIQQLEQQGLTQDDFLDTVITNPAADLFDNVSSGFDDVLTPDKTPDTVPGVAATDTILLPGDNTINLDTTESSEQISTNFNGTESTVIPTESVADNASTIIILEPVADTNNTVDTDNTVDTNNTVDTDNTVDTNNTVDTVDLTFNQKLDLAIQINGKDFTVTQLDYFKSNPEFLDSFIATGN